MEQPSAEVIMSIPLLIGLLVFLALIGTIAGVWRARGQNGSGVQSSLMMLVLVVVAALVVLFLFRGRM